MSNAPEPESSPSPSSPDKFPFGVRERWRVAAMQALARGEISSFTFAVAFALSTYANTQTGKAWPSAKTLAQRVGAIVDDRNDSRGVRGSLEALRKVGLVTAKGRGNGKSTTYQLTLPDEVGGDTDRNGCSGQTQTLLPKVSRSDGVERNGGSGQNKARVKRKRGDNMAYRNGRSGDPGMAIPVNLSNELFSTPTDTKSGEVGVGTSDEKVSDERGKSDVEGRSLAFEAAYPFTDEMNRHRARAAFAKLTVQDQISAVRCADVYAADIRRQNRSYPVSAAKWLGLRRFRGIDALIAIKGGLG